MDDFASGASTLFNSKHASPCHLLIFTRLKSFLLHKNIKNLKHFKISKIFGFESLKIGTKIEILNDKESIWEEMKIGYDYDEGNIRKFRKFFKFFFFIFIRVSEKLSCGKLYVYCTVFDRLNLNNINNGGLKYQNHPLNAIYSSFNTS